MRNDDGWKMRVVRGVGLAILALAGFSAYRIWIYLASIVETSVSKGPLVGIGDPKEKFRLGDQTDDDLFWFMQITDLHLSMFEGDDALKRGLTPFCDYLKRVIDPSVILITGDLTDSKTATSHGSTQYLDEWKTYKDLFRVFSRDTVFDIRGNHDTFDVNSDESPKNYFKNFSVQGPEHKRSYLKMVKKGSKTYGFIGVDATQVPGPRRPFNFVGILGYDEFKDLSDLMFRADDHSVDYLIWFGHYPTSCILSPSPGIRTVMAESGLVYLCGHFHTMHNLVTEMYTRQNENGMLELELGDWKDNRVFRILAIDHGLLSFVDTRYSRDFKEKPVILITNPKDSTYLMPRKEPLHRIAKSTHIRVLVFGDKIEAVEARIRREDENEAVVIPLVRAKEGNPLFVGPWSAGASYGSGSFELTITVTTSNKENTSVTQFFSLDGSVSRQFKLSGRLLLMANFSAMTQVGFGFLTFALVAPLCLVRLLHHQGRRRLRLEWIPIRPLRRFCVAVLRRTWIFVSFDSLFWPFLVFSLYLPVGPWAVGYMLSDKIGVLFAWGMIVDGSFLPADVTYLVGLLKVLFGQLPLFIIVSNLLDRRFQNPSSEKSYLHLGFAILMLFQFYEWLIFYYSYGLMAASGPLRLGSLLLSFYLWHRASSFTKEDFQHLFPVWK